MSHASASEFAELRRRALSHLMSTPICLTLVSTFHTTAFVRSPPPGAAHAVLSRLGRTFVTVPSTHRNQCCFARDDGATRRPPR